VLAILKNGATSTTARSRRARPLKLPDERNGLLMVFRTFEHLSYALVLEISDTRRAVGDRVVNPR
jgi:hypothetical protein